MGSGGGARGRDFEERAGAYARTYGFFPIAASVCRHVCVSMRKRSLKDVAQDVAENLLGAAENGGVKVLIVVFSLSSSGGTHAQQTHANPPRCPWATREGRAHKGCTAGRGGGRGGGLGGGRAAGCGVRPGLRASGPGRRAPYLPRHHRRRRLCAARGSLRWGRNWAAQWYLARAVGKRFRRCHAKRLYVYLAREQTFRCASNFRSFPSSRLRTQ